MSEETKQVWDNLFQKLNEKEKTFLAVVNNEKNKEIKRLNSIIKEVREYAEEIIDFVGDVGWVEIPSEDYIKKWQDILEILDKENDNGER